MSLNGSSILQINAAIVAGILILLTISSTQEQNPVWQLGKGFAILGWGALLPFCISAIYALNYELKIQKEDGVTHNNKESLRVSLWIMRAGFVVLIVYLGSYSFLLSLSK